MKLIADSGSTKTDWCLTDGNDVKARITTQGINPIHQSEETIEGILRTELLPHLNFLPPCVPIPAITPARPSGTLSPERTRSLSVASNQRSSASLTLHFYGSGVISEQRQPMCRVLSEALPNALEVTAESDLLGAARALCQHSEGIACILGTGANSCLYDGQDIVRNTPALGYILGDEGSGAVLGIRFLNALYKGALPDSLRQAFENETGLTQADVINRVYRQPLANRWLASLSTLIHTHIDMPEVKALVTDNFRQFVCRNVLPYGRLDLPLNAVGSIAWHYRDQLLDAVRSEGMTLGTVLQSPMDGLITYHS